MPLSATEKILLERIANDFSYHPPKGDQPARYEKIRAAAKTFALLIADLCPDRRERSLALTKLEEAAMWANASIARSDPPADQTVSRHDAGIGV
jgi:hypothetical protein